MSFHDVLALTAARSFVHQVNAGGAWRQVFTGSDLHLRYIRDARDWPVPDAVAVDAQEDSGITCAIEFKPPTSSKAECVRGVGQAITYLSAYKSTALIVPYQSDDGFEIAQYLASARGLPAEVGIVAYPSAKVNSASEAINLELLKAVGGEAASREPRAKAKTEEAFWAFWRDISLDEFYRALDTIDRRAGQPEARTTSLRDVHHAYTRRQTYDPQGRPRQKPNISEEHFMANLGITLSHLGLWGQDGLSDAGRRLVHLGRLFGPESSRFRDEFARRALLEGRHYDLVRLVYEFQQCTPNVGSSAYSFRTNLERYLEAERLLGRLPGRRTTGGRDFFKAEFTFWGQILRIIRMHGKSYVGPGGLDFDWPRIVNLLGLGASGER